MLNQDGHTFSYLVSLEGHGLVASTYHAKMTTLHAL